MNADDACPWAFTQEVTDTSEVRCRECGEWGALADWTEGTVPCDDCGEHMAIVCPKCREPYDHVWSENRPLEARARKD